MGQDYRSRTPGQKIETLVHLESGRPGSFKWVLASRPFDDLTTGSFWNLWKLPPPLRLD